MAQSTKIKVDRRSKDLREKLAVRLKDVLHEQNLNQSELAERAGLKVSYINRVLRKATNATLESIAKLETALNMELIDQAKGYEWLNSRKMPENVELKFESYSTSAEPISVRPSNLEEVK